MTEVQAIFAEQKAKLEQQITNRKVEFTTGTLARAGNDIDALAARAEQLRKDLADWQAIGQMLASEQRSISDELSKAIETIINGFLIQSWSGVFQSDDALFLWLSGQIRELSTRHRVTTTVRIEIPAFKTVDSDVMLASVVPLAQNQASRLPRRLTSAT